MFHIVHHITHARTTCLLHPKPSILLLQLQGLETRARIYLLIPLPQILSPVTSKSLYVSWKSSSSDSSQWPDLNLNPVLFR